MASVRIHVNLPESIVGELDTAADAEYQTRSGYITAAIVLKMQSDKVIEEQSSDRNSYLDLVKAAILASAVRRGNRN